MSAPQKLLSPESSATLDAPAASSWSLWLERGLEPLLAQDLGTDALPAGVRLFPKLGDIAELLDPETGAGRLVIALERLPAEDIGILRRFLARSRQRELVVLASGEALLEPPTGLAPLLALPRTRLLPAPNAGQHWNTAYVAFLTAPPEGLHGPAPLPPAQADAAPGTEPPLNQSWRALRDALEDREELAPLLRRLEDEVGRQEVQPALPEPIDLGTVAEELLAGLSLERGRRMRFLYRPEGELALNAPRQELELCLRHLFDLVGQCSSPDCVIRVRVSSAGTADSDVPVETTVEFPDAPLTDLPQGAELNPDTLARHFGPDASATLRQLRAATQSLGARIESLPTRPGRRQLRLRIPRA